MPKICHPYNMKSWWFCNCFSCFIYQVAFACLFLHLFAANYTLMFCSLYTFSQMVEVKEIVVVCDPSYKDIFEGVNGCPQHKLFFPDFFSRWNMILGDKSLPLLPDTRDKVPVDLTFTVPGKERQDSVYSGLQVLNVDYNVHSFLC